MKRRRGVIVFDLPLPCQAPEDFDDLDDEEIFIYDNGGLDLILIENAAELLRLAMMKEQNIERILRLFSRKYQNCTILHSLSFDLQNKSSYGHSMRILKKQIKMATEKGNCIYGVLGLSLEEGGHYGSFYKPANEDVVYIFDSMSPEGENKSDFAKLGETAFGTDVIFDENFTVQNSLQYTGGFSKSGPAAFDIPYEDANRPESDNDEEIIRLQSTESQNHFCYMWSIWSIHARMLGLDPLAIAEEILKNRIDPLIVIKRYIWAIFNYRDLQLINDIDERYREFFSHHWSFIWTNDPLRTFNVSTAFYKYRIPGLRTYDNLDDCFLKSYENFGLLEVLEPISPTRKSEETMRCFIRKNKEVDNSDE